ncbi:MAG: rhomboid family intramembrane serine protease [Pedobacter sp.]
MEEKTYRIVFSGDIAYGFNRAETRANLKRLCKYDDRTLDHLFSGTPAILKNNLSHESAQRYKAALDQTGAVCVIEDISIATIEPEDETSPDVLACPKCGQQQPTGLTCMHCGIVFAKFHQAQERKAAIERGEIPCPSSSAAETESGFMERMGAYFTSHQEQAFILKAFVVIGCIIFITKYLSGLLALFILLFPVLFLIYVRMEAAATDRPPTEVLAQHITFMPVMYTEGERQKEGVAKITYSLIFINVLIFYGFELNVNEDFILNNLLFLPHAPNLVNVPLSLFTSMFLHAGGMHLWGNMLFLWAIGTVVEKRIGGKKFLAFYLVAGIAASLLSATVYWAFFHTPVHGLGASGAISGVMGLFAVRCYFKSMVFPLPILGIFSLILPISLKIRLNSLVIIGLFFLADLSGGIGQVTGTDTSNIGHWAHIGGMVCGILLGMLFKLGEEAVEERHQEIGSQALSKGGDLYQAEESLRLALNKNPDNGDTMILLARLLSKSEANAEGEGLYRKGMDLLSKTRMKEVASTFKEYYARYLKGGNPETQFRIAAYYHQQKDYEWAARCLELLADDPGTPPDIREKAMIQCARQMELIGKLDIATHYYRKFIDTFPESPFHAKALSRLKPDCS